MTAKLTEVTKRLLSDKIYNSADSDNFYIGIGRSEVWGQRGFPYTGTDDPNPITAEYVPEVTEREERLFRYSLQSGVAVNDTASQISYVVPKFTWSSGTIYSAYDDAVEGHPSQSYYVITNNDNVYVCIKQGRTSTGAAKASTVKPTHTDGTLPEGSDNYIWKFLYSINATEKSAFVTSSFMPVRTSSYARSAGEIIGYEVVAGGSGYTGTPTATVIGNGTSAALTLVTSSNTIVDAYPSNYGSGYDYATVEITGNGNGASIRPIFAPKAGLGTDPNVDLRAAAVMVTGDILGSDTNHISSNEYRQIGIIRNPTQYGSSTLFTAATFAATTRVAAASSTNFAEDDIVTLDDSAGAWVDYIDGSNTFYVHQNEETGFRTISPSGNLVNTPGSGSTTYSSITQPDIDIMSGDILYIDNRAAITREVDAGDKDELKIVFQI